MSLDKELAKIAADMINGMMIKDIMGACPPAQSAAWTPTYYHLEDDILPTDHAGRSGFGLIVHDGPNLDARVVDGVIKVKREGK